MKYLTLHLLEEVDTNAGINASLRIQIKKFFCGLHEVLPHHTPSWRPTSS